MSPLTLDQLKHVCAGTPRERLAIFVDPLNACFDEWSVNGRGERAAFLGEFAHETMGFTHLEENLRYTTVEALVGATKPRWDALDADDAWGYLNQPERLGNRIYANRMGNGDEASGDGYLFRGRALPHLTGRDNYAAFSRDVAMNRGSLTLYVDEPDLLLKPEAACRAGGWFWQRIGGNALVGDFPTLTLRINGGHNGLAQRTALRDLALEVL